MYGLKNKTVNNNEMRENILNYRCLIKNYGFSKRQRLQGFVCNFCSRQNNKIQSLGNSEIKTLFKLILMINYYCQHYNRILWQDKSNSQQFLFFTL